MKINRSGFFMPVLAALVFSSCAGDAATAETSTAAEITEETVVSTQSPVFEEGSREYIVNNSLYSVGNVHRLKEKMEKAGSGGKTVVAYIGGSITEGAGGGKDGCYARLSYEYFRDTYGIGENVEYVNAGLSGTPSNLGVLRLQRDVLSYKPDIVFVEFAVNDSQDAVSRESYESLVRTCLESENSPAVILLFNVLEGGYSAQAHMKEIGSHYGLPMISAADALTEEFKAGRMKWQEYSGDYAHPNPEGHRLLCDFIANLYTAAENAPDSGESEIPDVPKYGAAYKNAVMITPDIENDAVKIADMGSFEVSGSGAPGFSRSWKWGGGSEPLKVSAHGTSFFVIYKRNNSDSMGSFDVYLNGTKCMTVNTNQEDGWGESFSEQIMRFNKVKDAELEIVPSPGSEGKQICILGFGCAENESLSF